MGAITRAAANNITTSGVILPAGINDASVASVTALAQVSAGDGITLISSQTASSSASLSFTTGIDSTYRTYMFKFINIHPSSDNTEFKFNLSANSGSTYNVTKTSAFFKNYHNESGSDAQQNYVTANDLAQSNSDQHLSDFLGADNDQSLSGTLYLFNPSSTTYVKHFLAKIQMSDYRDRSDDCCVGGYGNTTSACNAIIFRFSSGNIDAGTIHMYGIA